MDLGNFHLLCHQKKKKRQHAEEHFITEDFTALQG